MCTILDHYSTCVYSKIHFVLTVLAFNESIYEILMTITHRLIRLHHFWHGFCFTNNQFEYVMQLDFEF